MNTERGDIDGKQGLSVTAGSFSVNANVNNRVHRHLWPQWFLNIYSEGRVEKYIYDAFQRQSSFLGFLPADREWIIRQFGTQNINFFTEDDGHFPNDANTRGYCVTPGGIDDDIVSYQGLLKKIRTEWSNVIGIGIYPTRIDNEEHLIATLNHEVNHFLLFFRIIFDFKNSGIYFPKYKDWANQINSQPEMKKRKQFITECLGYMDGGSSLFAYGNSGNSSLHGNSGKDHEGLGNYNEAARFGSLLVRIQISVYNYLGRQYGLDLTKPQNYQLVDSANIIFQKYCKNVTQMLLNGLYNAEAHNLTKEFFIGYQHDPEYILSQVSVIMK